MSPELEKYTKENLDNGVYNSGKSDVYSLGLTFLMMITLEQPDNFRLDYYPNAITSRISQVSDDFQKKILSKMLEIDPNKRKTFKQLMLEFNFKFDVKYPVGNIYSSYQVSMIRDIRHTCDHIYDYEGSLFTGAQVLIKFYSSLRPDHLEQANCLVSNLLELDGKNHCFVKFYGAFIENNYIWLIHEYCPYTLKDIINMHKQNSSYFTEKEVFYLIKSLVEGFKYCYDNNIMHNNIRSDTLYINDQRNIKISNFNISYVRRKLLNTVTINNPEEYYLAPEIINSLRNTRNLEDLNVEIDPKTDIFSLGLVFLEMIALNFDLNISHSPEQLQNAINLTPYDWGKYILNKTLCSDPTQRADYSELLSIIVHYSNYLT
jgi:serine/threonine protein kinase